MKARGWFSKLGKGADDRSFLDAARDRHGRGASKWLAGKLGVSARQARRYLSGQADPSKSKKAGKAMGKVRSALGKTVAASKMKAVRTVTPGTVKVVVKSGPRPMPDGTRNIGEVQLDPARMQEVADLYEQGRTEDAEAAFNDHVVDQYGGGPESGLSDLLSIDNYEDGIQSTE